MTDKKQYPKLGEPEIKKWFGLVLKVNNGYELDHKELEMLGLGLLALNNEQMPENIRALIENAQKYFDENK